MKIISHRGFWKKNTEKNTDISFRRAFSFNFGVEVDVRDHFGRLVVSHNPALGNEIDLMHSSLLESNNCVLAINIKADGLAKLVNSYLINHSKGSWFVFDMSIPDMISHIDTGNPVRMSEFEKHPVLLEHADGIWLDSFKYIWYDSKLIESILGSGKKLCIVSSELHGRKYNDLWSMLLPYSNNDSLMICTDHPKEADFFF